LVRQNPIPRGYVKVFFNISSPTSRSTGEQALERIFGGSKDPDQATSWETRESQYDTVCSWGVPAHALLQRVSAIQPPVFVAAGDSDPIILPHYSYLLAGLIPHAQVKIYPDSAHGFLFQHHDEFSDDVDAFLADMVVTKVDSVHAFSEFTLILAYPPFARSISKRLPRSSRFAKVAL
jgi:pimeloyl-ACP methyl ester carboxylesterase